MFTSLSAKAIKLDIDFLSTVTLASVTGFDAVELPVLEIARQQAERNIDLVKNIMTSSGIKAGGWTLPVDFRGSQIRYNEGLAQLPAMAKIAATLGSSRCVTHILPYSDEVDFPANVRFHVARLRPIAEVLADAGCVLGLEFVGAASMRKGRKFEFVHTLHGLLDLIGSLKCDNVGILLDSWHWYTSRGTTDDILKLSAAQIVHVHVNDAPPNIKIDDQVDSSRLLPGDSGVIDIVAFLKAIARTNYDGPLVVEPFNSEHQNLEARERVASTMDSLIYVLEAAGL